MLTFRVMPIVLYDGAQCVKTRRFASPRAVGSVVEQMRLWEKRRVDEIVFLDIRGRGGPDAEIVDLLSEELTTPFAVGGGIKTADDAREVLRRGADKVVVSARDDAGLATMRAISDMAGAQAVVASIDFVRDAPGSWLVYDYQRGLRTGLELRRRVADVEKAGAGEILLQSVDRDGEMAGYDVAAIADVARLVEIPVVAASGAGCPSDCVEAADAGADAVAAASVFLWTSTTPRDVKLALKASGRSVRL